jgi:hypothetical protein
VAGVGTITRAIANCLNKKKTKKTICSTILKQVDDVMMAFASHECYEPCGSFCVDACFIFFPFNLLLRNVVTLSNK